MPIGAFRLNTISKLIAEATVIYARTALTITARNSVQVGTAQSKFGGASVFYPTGNNHYLETSGISIGSGDFTIECWARKAAASEMVIFDNRTAGTQVSVYVESNAGGNLRLFVNGSYVLTSSNSMTTDTWTHLAISRSGGVTRFFINGVVSTNTYTDSNNYGTNKPLNIGASWTGSTGWSGYLDEIRVSNSARYTSSFTPSEQVFVNDANTTLLIHGDGTNASTTFTDDNFSHRRAVSVSGDAQISTAQSKFGTASALFDGTGDRLSITGNDLAFGTGNFTVEMWFRMASVQTNPTLIDWRPGSNGAYIALSLDAGKPYLYVNSAVRIISSTALSANVWYHLALSRSGTETKLFVDGTQVGSTYTDNTNYIGTTATIGELNAAWGLTGYGFSGWIDEIRISNSARYTTAFTPSTTAFEPDTNTLQLLHCDGTTLSTQIYNDIYAPPAVGHQSKTVMPYGNAQISTAQSKFGGSSVLLDGTLDYLAVPYNASFAYGTGDFTIEFWIRFNALSTVDNKLIWDQSTGSGGAYPQIYVTTAQKFIYYANNANRCIGTTTAVINTWYHIAVSRTAGSTRLFVNGIQEGNTYSDSTNYLSNTTEFRIGQSFNITYPDNPNCYYDEIRVSNNSRYSTTFTPATAAFQSDANTILLIHGDGVNGSTKIVDDGSNPVVLDDVVVHASNTSTGSTITIPSAADIGDYAVLFDTSTTTTDTTPTNWTSLNKATTTGIRTNVSYKRLVSGDPGSTITGMAGTTRKIILIIKGNSDITNVTISTPGSQATTATPTNQTISGSVNTPTVFFATYASTGSITTRGWTTGTPIEYSSFSTSGIYVKALTYGRGTTPATATISMSDGGTNTLQSFSIKFS